MSLSCARQLKLIRYDPRHYCLPVLIHADDETPLIVSAPDFDMVVVLTNSEFASHFGRRSGSECMVLKVSNPQSMIDVFEEVIEAASTADDRPVSHACFDPIGPSGGDGVSAFEIESLLEGLKRAN